MSGAQPALSIMRMSLYTSISLIYNIYHLCCLCIDCYVLSALCCFWSVVYIRGYIYKILNVYPFDYMDSAWSGLVGPVTWLTTPVGGCCYSNWPSLVCSQSLCNVTFLWLFCVVTLPFWHFCWFKGFCHMTEPDVCFPLHAFHVLAFHL